jgi:hypothetical protein
MTPMLRKILVLCMLLFCTNLASAITVTIAASGIETLPEGAVQVDKHRYFYVESAQVIQRNKNKQLKLTVKLGNNYNIGGAASFANTWFIGKDSRYFFSLELADRPKKIRSNSQFTITESLEGITSTTIDLYFTLPNDAELTEARLFFTGRPNKVAKVQGASLPS